MSDESRNLDMFAIMSITITCVGFYCLFCIFLFIYFRNR
jgi:hypothetical protein